MGRFFSEKYSNLIPYTPGEQPKNRKLIKLNTNESPFPPSPGAVRAASEAAANLRLYSDPECTETAEAFAQYFGMDRDRFVFGNGSDEILFMAFSAFCDSGTPAVFPDITYGFYSVFADMTLVPQKIKALEDDFSVNPADYENCGGTVFIANPNAPTGMILDEKDIRRICETNRDNVVVIDEAYVDFGGKSALKLTDEYDNLLVVQTFSKSRSLAGARFGFAAGSRELIRDMNTVKYSINPYNVNSMTQAAAREALLDREYFEECCGRIIEAREYAASELKKLGFEMTPSITNFLFVRHDGISGPELFSRLRERGILVRHFDKKRISDYNRITVGRMEDMRILVGAVAEILEERP